MRCSVRKPASLNTCSRVHAASELAVYIDQSPLVALPSGSPPDTPVFKTCLSARTPAAHSKHCLLQLTGWANYNPSHTSRGFARLGVMRTGFDMPQPREDEDTMASVRNMVNDFADQVSLHSTWSLLNQILHRCAGAIIAVQSHSCSSAYVHILACFEVQLGGFCA